MQIPRFAGCARPKHPAFGKIYMKEDLSEKRKQFRKTARWLELRQAVIHRANHQCECAGGYKNGGEKGSTRCENPIVDIHHNRYPIPIGSETIDDLIGLCRACHASRHISSVLNKPDCCKYIFHETRMPPE